MPACWWPPRRPWTSGGFRLRGWVSLRWVITHMIEEYARHNGHADLLRENSTARPENEPLMTPLTRSAPSMIIDENSGAARVRWPPRCLPGRISARART